MIDQSPMHPGSANGNAGGKSKARISILDWLLILATPALWSVNYLVARTAPDLIAPHTLATARWALAGLLLAMFAWPEIKAKRHLIKHELIHCLFLGMMGMWICGAWVYIGARTTSANNIALIYALSPVFIALAANLFLREHLRKRQWLGIVVALTGLIHVVIKGRWSTLTQAEFISGDLWILGCAIAWAIYSIYLKRWPSAFSPLARLVFIALAGSLATLPWALVETFTQFAHQPTQWELATAGLVLAAAMFPSAGAYLCYATLQKNIGAARTSLVLYLGPIYAALFAWIFLAEPLYGYHAMGALVILPGIFLASQTDAADLSTAK